MKLKDLLKETLIITIIFLVVGLTWIGLELILYGYTTPRAVDSIITFFFSISIYYNTIVNKEIKKTIIRLNSETKKMNVIGEKIEVMKTFFEKKELEKNEQQKL